MVEGEGDSTGAPRPRGGRRADGDRMAKQRRTHRRGRVDADDPVVRALREVADEALEETVPERLLEVIRAARRQPGAGGDAPAASARPGAPPDEAS